MSFYVGIAGVIASISGISLLVTSSVLLLTQSRKETDDTTRRNQLYLASLFTGLSILIAVFAFLIVLYRSRQRGCRKKSKLLLIIILVLLGIFLLTSLLITFLINRSVENQTGEPSIPLRASTITTLTGLVVLAIGFVLIFFVLRKRGPKMKRVCVKKPKKIKAP